MKKIEKYIIAVITLIAIGAIGTAIYFGINKNYTINNNAENNIETNKDDQENTTKKTTLTFYKNDKVLSTFECDGECRVVTFDQDYFEDSDYYVKIKENIEGESVQYLGSQNINVIIEYCKNDICQGINSYNKDYFEPKIEKNKAVGIVLLYNIETGNYNNYNNISKTFYGTNMTILENKQNNEYNYTVLLKNGFSRELTTTPTIYDEVNRHMKFPKTDGDVLISENNYKFGVEELKTGKVIIKHEYDDIYSYDEDTYVAKKDGSYNVYNSKTNTKLFNKDYKIIYKINNNSYMVLNENKVQVINEKEKIISKNNFEVKEVCKNSYMQRGYRAYEQDGKYHIDICASDKIDKNGAAIGSYEAELNYKYDLKTRKFEGIINYNWSE